jgi:antitoxin (DNA-binding transcriptional repressor) of toxin-antitoxin stability system
MEPISVRELRKHASRYLIRVESGETVEVTLTGQFAALLVSPGPTTSAREQLVASSRLVRASSRFRPPRSLLAYPGTPRTGPKPEEKREERL